MGKKKKEHVVFDQMLVPKKSIPFSKVPQMKGNMVNRQVMKRQKTMH